MPLLASSRWARRRRRRRHSRSRWRFGPSLGPGRGRNARDRRVRDEPAARRRAAGHQGRPALRLGRAERERVGGVVVQRPLCTPMRWRQSRCGRCGRSTSAVKVNLARTCEGTRANVWIRTCPRFGASCRASAAARPRRGGRRRPAHARLGSRGLRQDRPAARMDGLGARRRDDRPRPPHPRARGPAGVLARGPRRAGTGASGARGPRSARSRRRLARGSPRRARGARRSGAPGP